MYEQELSEMNHMSQPAPIEDTYLEVENWHQYLNAYPSCPRTYPHRLELTKYFRELQLQGRYLFHMTITYTPYKDRNNEKKVKNSCETSSNEMRQNIYRCMSSNLIQVLKTSEGHAERQMLKTVLRDSECY